MTAVFVSTDAPTILAEPVFHHGNWLIWRFIFTAAIESRRNPRLQAHFVPYRYRHDLVEFKNPTTPKEKIRYQGLLNSYRYLFWPGSPRAWFNRGSRG